MMMSSIYGDYVSSRIPELVNCTPSRVWSYGSLSHLIAAVFDGHDSVAAAVCLSQIV